MPTDRAMYCLTLEEHHKTYSTPEQNEEWISLWRPTILASMQQAKSLEQHLLNR